MENASTGSMIILTMDVILLVACAIIHMTATCLHKYEGAKLAQKYMYEERTGSMQNKRGFIFFNKSFLHDTKNDSSESYDGVQKDDGLIVCFIINSLIVVGGCTVLYYVHIYFKTKQSFWVMIVLFFGNQGVVIPTIMIYKYESFRVYLKRQIQPIKDLLSRFSTSTRVCCRRDTRIHNMDDEVVLA